MSLLDKISILNESWCIHRELHHHIPETFKEVSLFLFFRLMLWSYSSYLVSDSITVCKLLAIKRCQLVSFIMKHLVHTLSSCILERCIERHTTGILLSIELLMGSAEQQSRIINISYLFNHVLLPHITSQKQWKKQEEIKQIVLKNEVWIGSRLIELSEDLETLRGLMQPLPTIVLKVNQLLSPVADKNWIMLSSCPLQIQI